jgi:hypothetical protein
MLADGEVRFILPVGPGDRNSLPKDRDLAADACGSDHGTGQDTTAVESVAFGQKRHSEQLSFDQLRLFVQELNDAESEARPKRKRTTIFRLARRPTAVRTKTKATRRGRGTLPVQLKRNRDRARSGGRRKAPRLLQPRPAAHRRRNQRALRIHSSAVAGDRRTCFWRFMIPLPLPLIFVLARVGLNLHQTFRHVRRLQHIA